MIEAHLDTQTYQTPNLTQFSERSEQLYALENKLAQEQARRSLIAFARYVDPLAAKWYAAEHLRRIADVLERVERGELRRVIIAVAPRHWKPVEESSLVLLADGRRLPLREVAAGDFVVSHEGRPACVLSVHVQGVIPVLKIKTHGGRELVCAPDHPVLTPRGWVETKGLREGVSLATLPRIEASENEERRPEDFRLAGYFIGDGSVTTNGGSCTASITCFDSVESQDLFRCAEALGYSVSIKKHGRHAFAGGVRDWLRDTDIIGKNSWTKVVPPWVFGGNNEQIAHFVGAYFACDGHINKKGNTRDDACVEFYSVSRVLLEGVQHLLLRLGISAHLRERPRLVNGKPYLSFALSFSCQDDVARFAECVPLFSVKAQRLVDWGVYRTKFDDKYIPDRIVSIEDAGSAPCRCLEVEADHSFTANDIVVHNSSIASERFPAWWLGRRPDSSIIVASYALSLAEKFSKSVRETIQGERYRALFAGVKIKRDSNSADDWLLEGGYRTTFRAVGTGGGISGHGARLILLDDVSDPNTTQSATQTDSDWRWYKNVIRTRLEPDGAIVVINNRVGVNDLTGYLLDPERNDSADPPNDWTYIEIPAVNADGSYLWEKRFGKEYYEKLQLDPTLWRVQYMQKPTVESGTEIRREWFEFVPQLPKGAEEQCRAVDTAWTLKKSEKKDPDYTASVGSAMNGGWMYLVEPFKFRKTMPDTVNWIENEKKLKPRVRFGMAKAAGETIAKQFLALLAIPTEDLAGESVDIRVRLMVFINFASRGLVKLVCTQEEYDRWQSDSTPIEKRQPPARWVQFLAEATAFPNGKHDDLLAACAGLTQMHGLRVTAPQRPTRPVGDFEMQNLINDLSAR